MLHCGENPEQSAISGQQSEVAISGQHSAFSQQLKRKKDAKIVKEFWNWKHARSKRVLVLDGTSLLEMHSLFSFAFSAVKQVC
jgi:hypothetical protein